MTGPDSMHAVWIERFGPEDQLVVREVPRPRPGAGEVLVQVEAAAVNPSDIKNVEGAMPRTTLPRIPGRDFAGTVLAGDSALLGLPVWGVGGELGFTRHGSHAEYVTLPAPGVRRRPPNLPTAAAAAVGVAFVTAWHGLIDAGGLRVGETVLVLGSSGAVGTAVTQIARWAGARVIGMDRRPLGNNGPEAMRPNAFVDAAAGDLAVVVQDVAQGGVDVAFNAVGGAGFQAHLSSLRNGGRMVSIASMGQREVTFDLLDFYHHELHLIGVDSLALDAVACANILDRLSPGFASGALVAPLIGREYPLEQARQAYMDASRGAIVGKAVLVMR
jgi:NADPH:quinone reductase